MEAHLGMTISIHTKDDDHPDQGVRGRNRNAGAGRDGGHRKMYRWVQKKTCFLVMVTVKFGFDFSFSTESRGSTGTTHGLGSPKNWFSALQLCHLGM